MGARLGLVGAGCGLLGVGLGLGYGLACSGSALMSRVRTASFHAALCSPAAADDQRPCSPPSCPSCGHQAPQPAARAHVRRLAGSPPPGHGIPVPLAQIHTRAASAGTQIRSSLAMLLNISKDLHGVA